MCGFQTEKGNLFRSIKTGGKRGAEQVRQGNRKEEEMKRGGGAD